MKNLKKIVVVAMFGMMCLGGYSTYEYVGTTNAEYLMMENVEALTRDEGTSVGSCARRSGIGGGSAYEERMFCDTRTNGSTIYPCPTKSTLDYYKEGNMDRCTR